MMVPRSTHRSAVVAGALALVLALTPGLPARADEDDPEPVEFSIGSPAELQKIIQNWNQMAWESEDAFDDRVKDPRGRTMRQYASLLVFTQQNDSRLAALHARATDLEAAGDGAGMHATLEQARRLFESLAGQLAALSSYQNLLLTVEAQEAALQAVEAKVPEADRAETRRAIDARRRSLPAVLIEGPEDPAQLSGVTVAMVRATAEALYDTYNVERARLAFIALRADEQSGVARPSRERTAPCKGPAPSPAADETPTIDRSGLQKPAYADEARRVGFEGRVIVSIDVDAGGCARRATLLLPTGAAVLDEAALDWAVGLRFHPAIRDGRPTEGTMQIATTFRLTD